MTAYPAHVPLPFRKIWFTFSRLSASLSHTKTPVVLVVDDEPAARRLMGANLIARGYKVLYAENGAEAVEVFRSNRIDVVLLDIVLPVFDGFEVCRRIREFADTPIIIVSARGIQGDRSMALDLGANDYFPKPVQLQSLFQRIQEFTGRT